MTPLSALAIDGVFDRARLARTAAELEAQVGAGLELGGQLFLALQGEVLADAGFGAARPGEPMRRDHLMLWMSSTKPVAAVAICQLWERGRLELDDPVALHIPEFAQGGKERVTVRHLLTHTGGLRMVDTGWPAAGWEAMLSVPWAAWTLTRSRPADVEPSVVSSNVFDGSVNVDCVAIALPVVPSSAAVRTSGRRS